MTAIADHHASTSTGTTDRRAIGLRRRRVFAGEWLKLRATRSTWWSVILAVLGLTGAGVFAGIGVAVGALAATEADVGRLGGTLAGLGFTEIVVPYLPSNAGAAIMQPVTEPGSLSPWAGFAVFAAYAVVGLAAATVVVRRRDA